MKNQKIEPYFHQGTVWEEQNRRYRAVVLWLSILFSLLSLVVAGLCALALYGLAPLKTFEPYIIEVDKTTGYTQILNERNASVDALSMTDRQAVTQANVVRYIRAREGYDPLSVSDNFKLAALLSTGQAAKDLAELYADTNEKSPVKVYGKNTNVLVEIKSVSFGNDTTALVRFSTEEKTDTKTIVRHWVSVVRFRYTSQPEKNQWRFDNPLGFQVTSYRRDQETVTAGQ
ncbi:type IV secretion system protein [Allorhizobium sp. BGMRC 0089]|uniref:virB8 family protein n=1 Tax=Allorhizobium sonneratiae TaxID=2934936 RepID=UPI0020340295|nr:type IV secretion system protein [Allorhizobium sonneratiae]MCM2294709.1 type IV secretion system protein [Allorhizobium sonneratiae]